jgi:hypothetical protein
MIQITYALIGVHHMCRHHGHTTLYHCLHMLPVDSQMGRDIFRWWQQLKLKQICNWRRWNWIVFYISIFSNPEMHSNWFLYFYILESGVTSHYEIDQSMISISDMKKIAWGEANQNPLDSTHIPMYINPLDSTHIPMYINPLDSTHIPMHINLFDIYQTEVKYFN